MRHHPMTLARSTLALLGAACLLGPVQAADEARARELMTLMRGDEFAAGAMKVITRQSQAEDRLTDAQVACVDAVDPSQLTDAVVEAFAKGLDNAEADTAIAFFRSSAGVKLMNLLNNKAFGAELKEPLTPEDNDAVRRFRATSAGNKILNEGIMVTATPVAKRSVALVRETVANCGKPAAR